MPLNNTPHGFSGRVPEQLTATPERQTTHFSSRLYDRQKLCQAKPRIIFLRCSAALTFRRQCWYSLRKSLPEERRQPTLQPERLPTGWGYATSPICASLLGESPHTAGPVQSQACCSTPHHALPVKCLHSQRAVKCVSQRPSSGNCMYLRGAASPAGPRLSNQEYDSGGGNQASICKAVRKDASLCIPYLQLQRHITTM